MRCSLTQSEGGLALLVCSSQLSHEVGAVVAGVVCNDGRQLEEETERNKEIMGSQMKNNGVSH